MSDKVLDRLILVESELGKAIARADAAELRNVYTQKCALDWMIAHDTLAAAWPKGFDRPTVTYPKPIDPVSIIARVAELEKENARLRGALEEIKNLEPRTENKYPTDWRQQIAECPECQRYKNHPIQLGICGEHRRPIYAQERHDEHEIRVLGYRAKDIARDTLAKEPEE